MLPESAAAARACDGDHRYNAAARHRNKCHHLQRFENAGENGKQPVRALEIFDAMQQQGIEPDDIAYSVLRSACEKRKRPEHALDIFNTMHQQDIVTNVITYSAWTKACEKGW